jgi:hypothetical protein
MIKSVTITNDINESIKLELTRPEKSGFIVQDIGGLGPVNATINTTKNATNDGAAYNSSSLDYRNITMQLVFMDTPKETIEDIRYKTYKYFPINKPVRVLVETDKRLAEIEGYIEKNEPTIFSNKEFCTLSIICPDPFFYSLDTNETVFYGVEPTFEFPFENSSLTDQSIEFGTIQNKTEQTVYYEGDSEVDVTIIMHATGDVSNVTIYNVSTREQMKLDTTRLEALTGSKIIAGDTITIKTRKNQKKITLLRDGKVINILNCLEKGTKWFKLKKGDNIFAYIADEGTTNLQFNIRNKIIYDGV